MRRPARVALLLSLCAISVAERRISCGDLVVELSTLVEKGDGLVHRLRFGGFVWEALKFAGGLVLWYENRVPTTDLRIEDELWVLQMSISREVVARSGLTDASFSLVSLFYLASRTWVTFLEADGDVFRVRGNGTLQRCDPHGRGGRIANIVLDCVGCRRALALELETEELAVKWLGFCRGAAQSYLRRHEASVRLGFVCPADPGSGATTRADEIITGAPADPSRTNATEIASTAGTRTTDATITVIEAKDATVPLVAACLLLAVSAMTVAVGLFAVRISLIRAWKKLYGASLGY